MLEQLVFRLYFRNYLLRLDFPLLSCFSRGLKPDHIQPPQFSNSLLPGPIRIFMLLVSFPAGRITSALRKGGAPRNKEGVHRHGAGKHDARAPAGAFLAVSYLCNCLRNLRCLLVFHPYGKNSESP